MVIDNYIKVLVIDDSAFMRKAITKMLESDSSIKVVGGARDGQEGIEKIQKLKPDLVTLDIEMPRMNGLEALKIIMDQMPLPVIMVSSLTNEGAKATLDALDLGAVDFIPKNLDNTSLNVIKIKDELIEKIKAITRKDELYLSNEKTKGISKESKYIMTQEGGKNNEKDIRIKKIKAIAIGTSTGGPKALQEVIPYLPKDLPCGVLIVQHMPAGFTGPFATRLNQISQIEVKEAEQNDVVKSGLVLIAPGDYHMKVVKKKPAEVSIELTKSPTNFLYRPSVDVMMKSVAQYYNGRSLGVIMTGMGYDGREGMRMIKNKDGRTIAQSKDTCVVFGMPKASIEINVVDKVVPLNHIVDEIINMV